ncbi:MAG: GIY-YIG nuclease family protein [Armatimonadota bacterium]
MGKGVPKDVQAINASISRFLAMRDADGRVVGRALGVYAFYDYDGEPIYVGQTKERLSTRIRRHLTNQRTDAVAMNVLDPFEVASIEVWPLRWGKPPAAEEADFQKRLDEAEYTVFQKVLRESSFGAVLNEKDIAPTPEVDLPPSHRDRIVPDGVFEVRSHPDTRIARRALTIARLAQVISERAVSRGLRRTLLTQARRLERLASTRLEEFQDEPMPVEAAGEETDEMASGPEQE